MLHPNTGSGLAENEPQAGRLAISGRVRACFVFDVGRSTDLAAVEAILARGRRPGSFRHKGRVADGLARVPLRMLLPVPESGALSGLVIDDLEAAFYDSGALALTWGIPFSDDAAELVALTARLYEHSELREASRSLAEDLLARLSGVIREPRLALEVEDYLFVHLPEGLLGHPPQGRELAGLSHLDRRELLARVLRAEEGALSEQEIEGALANSVAYSPQESCFIDWLGALLIGPDVEDERQVLELATVELMQLRWLDARLDEDVRAAGEVLRHPGGWWYDLRSRVLERRRLARTQLEAAIVHEGVDNALKLVGDDYLARLYRTAAERFHFDEWDASIRRKLATLEGVQRELAEHSSQRRSELLEWIIIVLIAMDIVLVLAAGGQP